MFKRLTDLYKVTFTTKHLEDRQQRLRIGQLAWQGGVEQTLKDLKNHGIYALNELHIKKCQKEYEEWLKQGAPDGEMEPSSNVVYAPKLNQVQLEEAVYWLSTLDPNDLPKWLDGPSSLPIKRSLIKVFDRVASSYKTPN